MPRDPRSDLKSTGRGLALLCVAALAGCGDEAPAEPRCDEEPSYGGEASDEAWYVMVDAYRLAERAHPDASSFTVPANGEVLTGSTPVAFTWSSPLALSCPLDCFREGHTLWPLTVADLPPRFAPPALAHLPPVTGDIHYVEVFVPGRECPIRTITTLEDWRPRVAEWEEMRGKGPLELVITSAYLEKNRIAEGPYRTTSTFQIQ